MLPQHVQSLFLCTVLLIATTDAQSAYEKDSDPPIWVDTLFIVGMVLIHVIYMAKVMDYALDHLNVRKHAEPAESADVSQAPPAPEPLSEVTSLGSKIAWKGLQQYSTKSDHRTQSREMKSPSFLCCLRCSPTLFTWERTNYFRHMLRGYMSVSTLIALVFFTEFVGNFLLEFVVTISLHFSLWYYALSLLLLPEVLFVAKVALIMCWHSVAVSWTLCCDENGDIESKNEHIVANTEDILFSFKSQVDVLRDEDKDEDAEEDKAKKPTGKGGFLQQMDEILNRTTRNLFRVNDPDEMQFIPDYFLATCWRLWFFLSTMLASMMATIFLGNEV